VTYLRVQIVGTSGSGKTTLAKHLSNRLKTPHYELDSIFWLPGWNEKPIQKFRSEVQQIVNSEKWILCGDYIDKLEGLTLKRAEAVIWLNYPARVFVPRMIFRTFRRYFKNEKVFGNSESMLNFWLRPSKSLLFITLRLYYSKGRRRQETKIKKYGYEGKIIEFKSPRELNKWLKQL
jgi:adenylate kinase family enzyme